MAGIPQRLAELEHAVQRQRIIAGAGILASPGVNGTVVEVDMGAINASSARATGMFDCKILPPPPDDLPDDFEDDPDEPAYSSNGSWQVLCYDSALPSWDNAGIATVNNQQFTVPRMRFDLSERTGRIQLKFTAPKEGIGEVGDPDYEAPEDAKCEIILLDNSGDILESSPEEIHYLVAVVRRDRDEDGKPYYRHDQAHTPGPINLTWYGACTDLLKETLQTGVQEE